MNNCSVCQQEVESESEWCCGVDDTMKVTQNQVPENGLSIEYFNGTNERQTIIDLLCDRSVEGEGYALEMKEVTSKVYHTEFYSKYGCVTSPSCNYIASDGSRYDLGDFKSDTDYLETYGSKTFFMNFCQNVKKSNCTADCAMCVEEDNGVFFCAGKLHNFEISDYLLPFDGVHINYTGISGGSCGSGRTVSMDLVCNSAYEFEVKISGTCDYVIEIESKWACPLNPPGPEPVCAYNSGGNYWDFRTLGRMKLDMLFTDSNQHHYYINFCKEVNSAWYIPDCTRCSVCQEDNNEDSHCLGLFSSATFSPMADPSKGVVLKYTGGDSCSSGKRNTTLNCYCDMEEPVGRISAINEPSDCNYEVEFYTQYACPSAQPIPEDCKFLASDGSLYDLSKLVITSGNDYMYNDTVSDFTYEINVCHDVVSTEPECQQCGSCQVEGATKTAHCAGKTQTMVLNDMLPDPSKGVILTYSDGEICESHGDRPRVSVINMQCNPQDTGVIYSINERETMECVYDMVFLSKYACPIPNPVHEVCNFTSPNTGHSFDISDLTVYDGPSYTHNDGSYEYLVNFCDEVHDEINDECKECAACMRSSSDSYTCLGRYNEMRMSDFPTPSKRMLGFQVYYSDGSECMPGKQITTEINMNCHEAQFGMITEVSKVDECNYHFEFDSMSACPLGNYQTCGWYINGSDVYYTASALTRTTFHPDYSVDLGAYFAYFNPCGTTEFDQSLCGDCSVCLSSSANTTTGTYCGGKVDSQVFNGKTDGTGYTLTYSKGSTCGTNGGNWTTTLHFDCKRYSTQFNIYKTSVDHGACTVDIYVESDWGCSTHEAISYSGSDCKYMASSGLTYQLDQMKIGSSTEYQYRDETDKEEYYANVCDEVISAEWTSSCHGCGVCQQDDDLMGGHYHCLGEVRGLAMNDLSSDPTVLGAKMTYYHGENCSDGTQRSTTLNLVCDYMYEQGVILELSEPGHCAYEAHIRGEGACPVDNCQYAYSNFFYDFLPLSTAPGAVDRWMASVPNSPDVAFLINFCAQVRSSVSGCERCSACIHDILSDTGTCIGLASNVSMEVVPAKMEGGNVQQNAVVTFKYNDCKATITMVCSSQDTVQVLKDVIKEGTCSYSAYLYAYEACPKTGYVCPSSSLGECSARGTCLRTGNCQCTGDYYGSACELSPYDNPVEDITMTILKVIAVVTVIFLLVLFFVLVVIAVVLVSVVAVSLVRSRSAGRDGYAEFPESPINQADIPYTPQSGDIIVDSQL